MLTLKQPVHYGYRPIHDLPTPPRSSTPVYAQEPASIQTPLPALSQTASPPTRPMSGTHRGLPLPAGMSLQQPPPPGTSHPPAPGQSMHSQMPPTSSPHNQSLGSLPAPPQWQTSSEESMRSWLMAKTEEERRKQEEEKSQQERLRLEQRKLEYDMLRTSLERGVPPALVPVVFAGMGGGVLPQIAMDYAQQYLTPQQAHQAQLLAPQGAASPESRRESQAYGQYSGSVSSTPGSAQAGHAAFVPYQGQGSPTRARAQTITSGSRLGGGGHIPRLSTGDLAPSQAGIAPPLPSQGHPQQPTSAPSQQQQHQHQPSAQQPQQQQETQSPSIYFHHWQPPTTNASSNQSGGPSVDSPRKRKATGPQQPAPPPNTAARNRSPPFSSFPSQPGGGGGGGSRRRGHSRQRSDISSYRSSARGRIESTSSGPGSIRGFSPGFASATTREEHQHHHHHQFGQRETSQPPPVRSNLHSVSNLLSEDPPPPPSTRFTTSEIRSHQQQQSREGSRRNSPSGSSADDKLQPHKREPYD